MIAVLNLQVGFAMVLDEKTNKNCGLRETKSQFIQKWYNTFARFVLLIFHWNLKRAINYVVICGK